MVATMPLRLFVPAGAWTNSLPVSVMVPPPAAATLPFPPVAGQMAVVPDGWTHSEAGTVPEFEVDLWGTGALNLTAGEMFAAKQRALTKAGVTVDELKQRVDDAQDFVKDKAPEVAEFLADGAKKVVAQVSGSSSTTTRKPAAKSTTSKSTASKSTTSKPAASKSSTAK